MSREAGKEQMQQPSTDVARSVAMAFPRFFSLPPIAIGAGYLAGYVLLDWISFIQPFAPFGITPWNPPTGLSFVLVLLFGQRFIPLLFVAPLLADVLVRQLPLPWSTEIIGTLLIAGGYAIGSDLSASAANALQSGTDLDARPGLAAWSCGG